MSNKTFKSERKSAFKQDIDNQQVIDSLWALKKAKAHMAISAGEEEFISGYDLDLSEEQVISAEDAFAAKGEPYGDVKYADPGYQKDGQKRYPIDTPEHIRAAWSYINQAKNAGQYSPGQVSKIKSRIVSAWKSKIDPKGPPSAA